MTEQQFSPLAARYMDTVFRVAYSYLRSPADADDVTQDVLIQLYKTDKAFDDDAHVKNWLIRVTVNRCKNVLRAPWHRTEDIADYENSLSFEEPQCHELFDAVMALDRRYRVPVLLYYYEGYRQKEIAGLLDIPEETVRTRLARAREKLKHILSVWGDRIFEKCGIRRDEGGDGGKTLEIRGKRRLSARDGGANYQQS